VTAYPAFAARVEQLSREEVESYITQVFTGKKDTNDKTTALP
jgi:hypothetical protein